MNSSNASAPNAPRQASPALGKDDFLAVLTRLGYNRERSGGRRDLLNALVGFSPGERGQKNGFDEACMAEMKAIERGEISEASAAEFSRACAPVVGDRFIGPHNFTEVTSVSAGFVNYSVFGKGLTKDVRTFSPSMSEWRALVQRTFRPGTTFEPKDTPVGG